MGASKMLLKKFEGINQINVRNVKKSSHQKMMGLIGELDSHHPPPFG
jgi:hypothetical protein